MIENTSSAIFFHKDTLKSIKMEQEEGKNMHLKKKLMSRRAFTPTQVYLKVKDIADNPKYNINLHEAQEMVGDRDKNGLLECGMQIGRRFFIDQDKLENWLKNR